MTPMAIKTVGYLASTLSVVLLGLAAWPGAREAGLLTPLALGMGASVTGMALRWWSYRLDAGNRPDSAGAVPACDPNRTPPIRPSP